MKVIKFCKIKTLVTKRDIVNLHLVKIDYQLLCLIMLPVGAICYLVLLLYKTKGIKNW